MRQMRQLTSENDFASYAQIGALAYPGMRVFTTEDREKLKQSLITQNEDAETNYYGLFDDQTLLGGMCLLDFTMNVFSLELKAGGVGFVGVDLLHKKEAVAKEMISFFLYHCRANGQHIAMLYPFRPDFYKRMGFGYGNKISQYRVQPAHLARGVSKSHVQYLDASAAAPLTACYNRYYATRHGLIKRAEKDTLSFLKNPERITIGYMQNGVVEGYLGFGFQQARSDTSFRNNIVVRELVYEHGTALAELLTFLHTQADQIDQVIFSLHDDAFHHLLFDPRNGTGNNIASLYHETNTQGVGIMYRVVDTRALLHSLATHNFGGQSCTLKLSIRDSFLPENAGDLLVRFEQGCASIHNHTDYDVAIELDIADFSSLLMGAISFRALYRLNLVSVSDARQVPMLDTLFHATEPPICMTFF